MEDIKEQIAEHNKKLNELTNRRRNSSRYELEKRAQAIQNEKRIIEKLKERRNHYQPRSSSSSSCSPCVIC